MPEGFDETSIPSDTDVVVPISAPDKGGKVEQCEADANMSPEPQRRFRRRLERFRGIVEEQGIPESLDDEDELRLQVMLLREENARLSAARHKPPDPGTLIDHVRMLGARSEASEVLDETWSILSECLALREGLDQACVEIQAAISSVRDRLGKLAAQIDALDEDASSPDAKRTSLTA